MLNSFVTEIIEDFNNIISNSKEDKKTISVIQINNKIGLINNKCMEIKDGTILRKNLIFLLWIQ